jgi:hypothetical protein
MNKWFLIAGLAFAAWPVRAETGQPTPAELLAIGAEAARLPEAGAWKIDIGPAEADGLLPRAASIAVERTGQVQRDRIDWSDGRHSEAWHVGGEYIAENPPGNGIVYDAAPRAPAVLPWLDWITEKNVHGVETFAGERCAVFADTVPWTEYAPGYFIRDRASGGGQVTAYVSLKERHLVALRAGSSLMKFIWLVPPKDILVLPAPLAEKRDAVLRKRRAMFGNIPLS